MSVDEQFEWSDTERRLLNDFQRDLPLESRPFQAIAERLGTSEERVLELLRKLKAGGAVTRVGPVFAPNRVGASTLAAMAVPEGELLQVAARVSRYPEVNHNYEREHRLNLWFVVTAADEARREAVLDEIAASTGYEVIRLPMLRDYYIDLGFELEWERPDAH